MTIRIMKPDRTWAVISGGGSGPTGSVGFADLTGLPTDNAQLASALGKKLTVREGTFETGKDALGEYVWSD